MPRWSMFCSGRRVWPRPRRGQRGRRHQHHRGLLGPPLRRAAAGARRDPARCAYQRRPAGRRGRHAEHLGGRSLGLLFPRRRPGRGSGCSTNWRKAAAASSIGRRWGGVCRELARLLRRLQRDPQVLAHQVGLEAGLVVALDHALRMLIHHEAARRAGPQHVAHHSRIDALRPGECDRVDWAGRTAVRLPGCGAGAAGAGEPTGGVTSARRTQPAARPALAATAVPACAAPAATASPFPPAPPAPPSPAPGRRATRWGPGA